MAQHVTVQQTSTNSMTMPGSLARSWRCSGKVTVLIQKFEWQFAAIRCNYNYWLYDLYIIEVVLKRLHVDARPFPHCYVTVLIIMCRSLLHQSICYSVIYSRVIICYYLLFMIHIHQETMYSIYVHTWNCICTTIVCLFCQCWIWYTISLYFLRSFPATGHAEEPGPAHCIMPQLACIPRSIKILA